MSTRQQELEKLCRAMVRGSVIEGAAAKFFAQCFEEIHRQMYAGQKTQMDIIEENNRLKAENIELMRKLSAIGLDTDD